MRARISVKTIAGFASAAVIGGLLIAPADQASAATAITGVTLVYPTVVGTTAPAGNSDVFRIMGPSPSLQSQGLSSVQFTNCTGTTNDSYLSTNVSFDSTGTIATVTMPHPTFTGSSGSCQFYPNAQAMPGLSKQLIVSYSANAMTITGVSPGGYAATPPIMPTVALSGTNIAAPFSTGGGATAPPLNVLPNTSVFMTNCIGLTAPTSPYSAMASTNARIVAGNLQFKASNGISPSDCDIVVAVPSSSGGASGLGFDLVASLNTTTGGGFTWRSVIQGVAQIYPTLLNSQVGPGPGGDVFRVVGSASPTLGSQGISTATLSDCVNTGKASYTATSLTLGPTSAMPQNGRQTGTVATIAMPRPAITNASQPATCSLMLNGSQPSLTVPTVITYASNAPSITTLTPSSYGQTPTNGPNVMVAGTQLVNPWVNSTASPSPGPLAVPAYSSVFMTNCQVTNANQYPANTQITPTSTFTSGTQSLPGNTTLLSPSQLEFVAANGVLSSDCDVVIPVPRTLGAIGTGYDFIASVNRTTGGGFDWVPPYQGPITLTVTNPYNTDGTPRSGITDANLILGLQGASGATGPQGGVSGFTGTGAWLTTAFTGLASYKASTHSATLSITPQWLSGDLYFLDSVTTAPPDPKSSTGVRYGFIEFSYTTTAMNVDLTLIDQAGVMMTTTQSWKGSYIPGSYQDTGCLVNIVNQVSQTGVDMTTVMKWKGTPPTTPAPGTWTTSDLAGTYPATSGTLSNFSGLIGASKIPSAYPSLQNYVTAVQGLAPLQINDNLGNSPPGSEGQNGVFNYTATYYAAGGTVGNVTVPSGYWALVGTIGGGNALNPGSKAVPGPLLLVEGASMYAQGSNGGTGYSVYGQDGPFQAYLSTGANTFVGANPFSDDGGPAISAAWGNTVKTIFRDFVTPFANGLWGSTVAAFAPGTSTGQLTQTFTVDPRTQAFNAAQPSYGTDGNYGWNSFQQAIVESSNAYFRDPTQNGGYNNSGLAWTVVYGMPYGDTMLPSSMSPLLSYVTADAWNITLGDPAACPNTASGQLLPPKQTVVARTGVQFKPQAYGTLAGVGQMEEWKAVDFPDSGAITYTLLDAKGSPIPSTRTTTGATVQKVNGLTFDPNTGVLSGEPTAGLAQTTYTVRATKGGAIATSALTIQIAGSGRLHPSTTIIDARAGQPLSATPSGGFTTQGLGASPAFTVNPALPAGLSLSSQTGAISGNPTLQQPSATYIVTGSGEGSNATAIVTITVAGALSLTPQSSTVTGTVGQSLTSTAPNPVNFPAGSAITYSLTQTGVAADPPQGLQFSAATGVLSGTPTAPTSSTYTILASSPAGSADTILNIEINPVHGTLQPGNQTVLATVGGYIATGSLAAFGLGSNVSFSVASGSLPSGLNLNTTTGVVSGPVNSVVNGSTVTIRGAGSVGWATATIAFTFAAPPSPPTPNPTPTPAPTPSPNPTPVCPKGTVWVPADHQCEGIA